IMAVFPNIEPGRLSELGNRIVEKARTTPLKHSGKTIPITISLGASHNLLAETNSSFEGLVQMAGRALFMAKEGNGDRYVMWPEAEAEIDGLRAALEERKQSFAREQQ